MPLSPFVGVNDNAVMPKYCPLLEPAGENQAALLISVAAIIPAVEEDAGMNMN